MQVNVGQVGPVGGVDLNRAMSTVYNETRAFLMHNYDLTEDMVSPVLSAFCNTVCVVPGLQESGVAATVVGKPQHDYVKTIQGFGADMSCPCDVLRSSS